MKKITSFLTFIYKSTVSKLLKLLFGGGCRFEPTCSEYVNIAIQKYGIIKGTKISFLRLIKCHPFSKSFGWDPIP
ncbi:MAG TPA: membrane protein insertion efficiency factor YidD [Patescibacteria group bacterium]|nr:membrane protein insertion efficiency factor YidD [Patescibacteria group bacterium]